MTRILNRELFVNDPIETPLINNGQARISSLSSQREKEELISELKTFVCDGQYGDGLTRIVESFLHNLDRTNQPAAWVSGFYGSGKSHLLKMLGHLWENTQFPELGTNARNLVVNMPNDLQAALKELDIRAKRSGGRKAAMGALPSDRGGSVRLNILSIIFRSVGLPETYAQARFCLYLRNNGFLEKVEQFVTKKGKSFLRELGDLYVSPVLREALVAVDPNLGSAEKVRELIKAQFVQPTDIGTDEFIRVAKEVLTTEGSLPLTVLILDEVQLFIGGDSNRATQVVEIAEALCKQMDSKLLLVGAGQHALGSETAQFAKLKDRFTIPVELSDTDVEAVTRKVLLQKKNDKVTAVKQMLDSCRGEIDRQLAGSAIAVRASDDEILVDDYPMLPVRRRFWEKVSRAVDQTGTAGLLRTQLRIIHDALGELATKPLGSVVPADFMFEQLQTNMVQQGVLLRELDERIRGLRDGSKDGELKSRICGLVFLIRRLPRESGSDIGVRASNDMLADLMIEDLTSDGVRLRQEVPRLLHELVEDSVLLQDGDEYNLQTRDSLEWDKEYKARFAKVNNDEILIGQKRDQLLRGKLQSELQRVRIQQGQSKESRELDVRFDQDVPTADERQIPLWVRTEWESSLKEISDTSRKAGVDSPLISVFVPKGHAEELRRLIVAIEASAETLRVKGPPSTPEGEEAKRSMTSRRDTANLRLNAIVDEIVGGSRVFKGGGAEVHGLSLADKIKEAGEAATGRLFPRFNEGDHKNWRRVFDQARNGDDQALVVVDHRGSPEQHAVCAEIIRQVGAGKEGREIRKLLQDSPFGWGKDCIDACLVVLLQTGKLIAREGSRNVLPRELDQTKISKVEFRTEHVTLSVEDKLKLRELFKLVGVNARSNEDLGQRSDEFIDATTRLFQSAGGEAPLPALPKSEPLESVRALAGNERLAALVSNCDQLKTTIASASELRERRESRVKCWRELQDFLKQGEGLSAMQEVREDASAIESSRLLLDKTDRVTPLHKQAAQVLRAETLRHHESYKDIFTSKLQELEETEVWRKLSTEQRAELLQQFQIMPPTNPNIETDVDLYHSLKSKPLSLWEASVTALPERFAALGKRAAALLEPKVQSVRMERVVLRTEAEVKSWVKKTESHLLELLKKGPVLPE